MSLELLELECEYAPPRDKVLIDLKYREDGRLLGMVLAIDWDTAHDVLLQLADAVAEGAGDRD